MQLRLHRTRRPGASSLRNRVDQAPGEGFIDRPDCRQFAAPWQGTAPLRRMGDIGLAVATSAAAQPGPYNPLGARALYLHDHGKDTLYRIHGTNDPDGVGFDGTSGCFRLTNTDILDLYGRVKIGAKVVVE